MIICLKNSKVFCPGCGQEIAFPDEFTLDISETAQIVCPNVDCAWPLFISVAVSVVDVVYVRSNTPALLAAVESENDVNSANVPELNDQND